MGDMTIIVGGSAEDDAADFLDAWKRGERGERLLEQRVLGIQSWEGLSAVLTGVRLDLLRHVHDHPDVSINAVSQALERQDIGVRADVMALEHMGLLHRVDGRLRASTDRIRVEVRL